MPIQYPTSIITGILLDAGWQDLAPDSLIFDQDPVFLLDDGTLTTPIGGTWLRWTDAATGALAACPITHMLAVRTAPVAQIPAEQRAALGLGAEDATSVGPGGPGSNYRGDLLQVRDITS